MITRRTYSKDADGDGIPDIIVGMISLSSLGELDMNDRRNIIEKINESLKNGDKQMPEELQREFGEWVDKRRIQYPDPMLPPWKKFPEMLRESIGWRMGPGEEYNHNFFKWYNLLSDEDKQNYIVKYPEPNSWDGFYDLVEERNSSKNSR